MVDADGHHRRCHPAELCSTKSLRGQSTGSSCGTTDVGCRAVDRRHGARDRHRDASAHYLRTINPDIQEKVSQLHLGAQLPVDLLHRDGGPGRLRRSGGRQPGRDQRAQPPGWANEQEGRIDVTVLLRCPTRYRDWSKFRSSLCSRPDASCGDRRDRPPGGHHHRRRDPHGIHRRLMPPARSAAVSLCTPIASRTPAPASLFQNMTDRANERRDASPPSVPAVHVRMRARYGGRPSDRR